MGKRESGFTLIEIAIVLVIIGLLLGGVLKGQELITGARVRNLIQQQDGVKAAYFGFLDRYRALPGDYKAASTTIPGATADGNADGQIKDITSGIQETVLAWEHLAKSGFINGSYVYGTGAQADTSNPKNPYAAYMQLAFDAVYSDPAATTTSTPPKPSARHNLKTGAQIPVEIVAELDRKVDDGTPYTGAFQFSEYQGGAAAKPTTALCISSGAWAVTTANANCGGASLY